MRLHSVVVRNYRNYLESETTVHPSITCIVGKNESGKTAFLNALYRLNPARPNATFSVHEHYPAWLEKRDRQKGLDLDRVQPITATFALSDEDRRVVAEEFGEGVFEAETLTISRDYGGVLYYTVDVSEARFVAHVVASVDWPRGTKTGANKAKSISDLSKYAEELAAQSADEDGYGAVATAVRTTLTNLVGDKDLGRAVFEFLKHRIPKFLYFADYSKLPYSVGIARLLTADPSSLEDHQLTARSLLRLAAAEDEYLSNPDYERRKRELENVANALTDDVLKYWTQNPELRVQPEITQTTVTDSRGTHSVLDELKIRIWDQRHMLSLPFNEHSTGFQWFFSFLIAFSEYEFTEDPVVILLDEPALGLHARAQADFLRFIEERIAARCQVMFTTHSPFMVQPGKLERVRLVEDRGKEEGAKLSDDVNSTDSDTLFPLQGALGYDLAQNLFISPNNLVVEGTSDFTYLRVISDYFAETGDRVPLDERWSIVPVGGVDLVPTFVALLGHHLDLTVLVDGTRGGNQRLTRLTTQGLLIPKRIITAGEPLGLPEADIEDLFAAEDYVNLVNRAFGTEIRLGDLEGSDPIVKRIARNLGRERFDHGRPADLLLRKRDEVLPNLTSVTLDNFEALFERINATIAD